MQLAHLIYVTLFEKNGKLGGHLIEATVPNFKDDLRIYMDWLIREVQKLEVKIELNKEVTSQFIDDAKPDAIVIATGSTTYYPDKSAAFFPSSLSNFNVV